MLRGNHTLISRGQREGRLCGVKEEEAKMLVVCGGVMEEEQKGVALIPV